MAGFLNSRRSSSLLRMSTLVVALGAFVATTADASATTVVALGASQTYGKGVARGKDFPAQLEILLKAKGLAVHVINAGINGDTTAHMAARLDRVLRPDTKVVILQPGGNDARKGQGDRREGNLTSIRQTLQSRGIKVVMVPNSMFHSLPRSADQQHLTPEGYHQLASELVSEVASALQH
ncbi:GDSL-type esterase/lipase family protein [Rhizobium sp. NPDC090279]|uniref:GDSL-type esterase/lipase family protein n=1 Tax=Rhizobium sp. NPDC090279 TaxID=3364499 RepID=UPI00383A74C1